MSGYLLTAMAAALVAAQATTPTPQPAAKKSASPAITLTGCVSQNTVAPGSYTFSDMKTGARYRLTGIDIRKEAGKRAEATIGTGALRVTIRGGLVPSANVAAQAGAIDPASAAVASLPGGTSSTTGSVELPEFRVTRLRAIDGSCP